ncbi:MAG: ribonuclease E/G [Candidatus Methanofastidiosia archaeon]
MKEIAVRIRGIYTTALTKYLKDKGYRISKPSEKISLRLDMEREDSRSFDLDIRHSSNRQGISVVGNEENILKLEEDLKRDFLDIFVTPSKLQLYGIYKAKNLGEGKLDLGEVSLTTGIRTLEEYLMVQVSEIDLYPTLTTEITYPSEYVVLIPGSGVKISRKIRGEDRRRQLLELGERIETPDDFGLLWRTKAENVEDEELETEALKLVEEYRKLHCEFEEREVGLLKEGKSHIQITFGGETRRKLDFIRNNVFKTTRNHHKLKSYGKDLSLCVDVYERLMAKNQLEYDLETLIREIRGPKRGNLLQIEHLKLDGRRFILGKGKITKIYDSEFEISRRVYSEGVYDGLNAVKEVGDKILTKFRDGAWYYSNTYLSKSGMLKGIYYNVCTPLEVFPYLVRYIDLEIDVVKKDQLEIIDEDILDKRVEKGFISEELAQKAKMIARRIAEGVYV